MTDGCSYRTSTRIESWPSRRTAPSRWSAPCPTNPRAWAGRPTAAPCRIDARPAVASPRRAGTHRGRRSFRGRTEPLQRHGGRSIRPRLCWQLRFRSKSRAGASQHDVGTSEPDRRGDRGRERPLVSERISHSRGRPDTPLAETRAARLTAWTLDENGDLSQRRTWADLGQAVPDGICLDAEGAVWFADPVHREVVRVAEGGKVLDRIRLDQRGAYACMLGGPDRRSLFICTSTLSGPETAVKKDGAS